MTQDGKAAQNENTIQNVNPLVDVSIILNIHREWKYLRATLRSLCSCAKNACQSGISCELVAVFDRSDKLTRQVFAQTEKEGFARVQQIDVNFGSLGLSRNAGIANANGKYIWTADGDDLVSKNAIVELHKIASQHEGSDFAVFLQYLVIFGDDYYVDRYYDSSYLTVADFAYEHPYVSRIFVNRSAFIETKYLDIPLSEGYAYEDWEFLTRLRYRRFHFFIAPNTVLYYRRRGGSLLSSSNSISAKIIPHTPLFDPKWFVEELKREKSTIGNWQNFIQMRRSVHKCKPFSEIANTPELFEDMLQANKIDPAVDPSRYVPDKTYPSVPASVNHWGYLLAEAFRIVGYEKFTDAVLLPWLNEGEEEKYILDMLYELAVLQPESHFLVLTGEFASSHVWMRKLPRCSVFLDVYNAFPGLTDEARDRLVVRLLLAVSQKGTRLHIKGSRFAYRLINAYGTVLLGHFKGIYYRFSDNKKPAFGDMAVSSSEFQFVREYSELLHLILCDNLTIKEQDRIRLGFADGKYRVVHDSVREWPLREKHDNPQYRLLWVSRIYSANRPWILLPLITRISKTFPGISIDIYGSTTDEYDLRRLFKHPELHYMGPYDDFHSLPTESYDAMIYTGVRDGMPDVVLEAMMEGLAVIASNAGCIPEIILDGVTGYLVDDDPEDNKLVANYCDKILELYDDWKKTTEICRCARESVAVQHGNRAFSDAVRSAFLSPREDGDESTLTGVKQSE